MDFRKYYEFAEGTAPVILSCPHGGYKKPRRIPDKVMGPKIADKNTYFIAKLIIDLLKKEGIENVWGLIGGNCGLCDICAIQEDKPCRRPDEARMSLEAIGIDVLNLLVKLGLDSNFHSDRITWTGCILY